MFKEKSRFYFYNIFKFSIVKIQIKTNDNKNIKKNHKKKNGNNNNTTTKDYFNNNNNSLYFPKSKKESFINFNNLEIFNAYPAKIKYLKTLNFDFSKIEGIRKTFKNKNNNTNKKKNQNSIEQEHSKKKMFLKLMIT